jgi:DNA ligase (NAD+)
MSTPSAGTLMQLLKTNKLDKNLAESRINQLRQLITHHNRLYYESTPPRPEISDQEYDELFRQLQQLEAAFPEFQSQESPTQTVGSLPSDGFKKVQHSVPMLSIENKPAAKLISEVRNIIKELKEKSIPIEVVKNRWLFHVAKTTKC